MYTLDRPIIVVGTGRCGSTMLHRLLARHPEVGWLSTFNEMFPGQSWLSIFSSAYRWRQLSHRTKHRAWFPKPFEAYRYWDYYLPGFSRRDRTIEAVDIDAAALAEVRGAVGSVLRYQRKKRLLVKVTGWSRMGCFDRLFPDSRFIVLRREHRSVISSWIKAGWLDVTSAPDSRAWQWGPIPEEYFRAWKELGGGPVLSAALKIQLDLDDIEANVARFADRCHELDYDDLIARPLAELRSMTEFSGLSWPESYEREMKNVPFHDTRDKWKQHLSEEEGKRVLEFFRRAKENTSLAYA